MLSRRLTIYVIAITLLLFAGCRSVSVRHPLTEELIRFVNSHVRALSTTLQRRGQ